MDSVEMVPADTTSEYGHVCSHSPDEPPSKRPKLASSVKQRPVGIAQPIRLTQPPDEDPPDLSDHTETQDENRFDRFYNESWALEDKKISTVAPLSEGSTAALVPPAGSTGVPGGRKWVVFISHSTGDQALVRNTILVPLRELQIPVAGSYHYMHSGNVYNNDEIRRAMADSCMVIIALSPSYVASSRCQSERRAAVRLCSSLMVVVVAVGSCSRPESLRPFLYLDFMDKSKKDAAWNKLTETIDTCMMSPGDNKEGDVNNQQKPLSQQHKLTLHTLAQHDEQHTVTDHPHILTEHTFTDHPPHTLTDNSLHALTDHPHTLTEHTFTDHHPHNLTDDSLQPLANHPFHTLTDHPPHTLTDHPPHTSTAPHQESESIEAPLLSEKREVPSSPMTDDRDSQPLQFNVNDEMDEVKGHSDNGDRVHTEDVEEGEVDDSSDEVLTNQIKDNEDDQASKVTSFYNKLARPDADKRHESPIFHMRNFNNWVKSVLIRGYLHTRGATVLDLCCGKGGDLLKWKEGRISYLACADISNVSVKAAEGRYNSPKMVRPGKRPPFDAEFICADCCLVRLRDLYSNPGRRFNMTSCQFSIHYSFESADKAHMMIRNACENLVPGGYFVGTTVDANELVYRLREAGQTEEGLWTFGNEVFSVTLDPSLDPRDKLPLFGAKYNFKLHGVVDLPEYIIHFPTFQSLLAEFDMEFRHKQSFVDFFKERRDHHEDADLLYKMSAFDRETGSMSAAQWEAIGLYMVFVFQKRSYS